MNRRTKEINTAILEAKKRDDYRCRKCGIQDKSNHGAHLVGRNTPYKKNDPTNVRLIITLCYSHHTEYDSKTSLESRIEKLEQWGMKREIEILKELLFL